MYIRMHTSELVVGGSNPSDGKILLGVEMMKISIAHEAISVIDVRITLNPKTVFTITHLMVLVWSLKTVLELASRCDLKQEPVASIKKALL